MPVYQLTLGMFAVNNYIVHPEGSKEAMLVDACEETDTILRKLDALGLELKYLLNTHGHADHIAGNAAILKATGAKLLVGEKEVPYLKDPNLNLSILMGHHLVSPPPDRTLAEGDTVTLGDLSFEVLFTPGHSFGHITLVAHAQNFAFVGDVIFRESIGRTDFPGGDYDTLISTIRNKIYPLPDDMVLYNGHGPATTVGHEKRHNPFVRGV